MSIKPESLLYLIMDEFRPSDNEILQYIEYFIDRLNNPDSIKKLKKSVDLTYAVEFKNVS